MVTYAGFNQIHSSMIPLSSAYPHLHKKILSSNQFLSNSVGILFNILKLFCKFQKGIVYSYLGKNLL